MEIKENDSQIEDSKEDIVKAEDNQKSKTGISFNKQDAKNVTKTSGGSWQTVNKNKPKLIKDKENSIKNSNKTKPTLIMNSGGIDIDSVFEPLSANDLKLENIKQTEEA